MAESRIVVVGAGVAGLTTALLLSKDAATSVTVVAKHMPGDLSIEYASPWAGANFLPVSIAGSEAERWDRDTWPELERLARDVPGAGVHFQDTFVYSREKGSSATLCSPEPWFKDMLPQFRTLEKDELRGYDSGFGFTSVCINTALYLPWLLSQCLAAGVVVKRGVLKHIAEAAAFHHTGSTADVVVNCTGLASRSLGGVADEKLFPARGQTVLVRNEAGVMSSSSDWEESDEGFVYVMERAAGGGTILGGSYQKNNWSNEIDHELANRIMQRAVALCPTLTHGQGFEHLSVIRHNVGLRPARQGGVRLGAERIGAVWTVHNYGHGGFGYQSSYGCSQAVVRLVADVLAGGGAGLG